MPPQVYLQMEAAEESRESLNTSTWDAGSRNSSIFKPTWKLSQAR